MKTTGDQQAAVVGRSEVHARPLPDFLIIGGAKCGTTTLYDQLATHEQVRMASIMSPCYFSDDSQYAKGPDWYASLFEGAAAEQKCGEVTTSCTLWPKHPGVPERIHQANPDVRLIYIMRDPVQRAESLHKYRMRHSVTATFEEDLEARWAEYVDAGRYAQQIEQHLKVFPRESLLLLLFDDLREDPKRVLDEVQAFIGVGVRDLTQSGVGAANVGAGRRLRWRTTRRLRRFPGASALLDATPASWKKAAYERFRRSRLAKRIVQASEPPPMKDQTRRRLIEIFQEPNRQLAELLGRDLSHWTGGDQASTR